jgi:hypothetical protein
MPTNPPPDPERPTDRPRLIEGKVGPAAEAALKMLHESGGATVKVVLRDKSSRAYAAIVLIEGDDTDDIVRMLDAYEDDAEHAGDPAGKE